MLNNRGVVFPQICQMWTCSTFQPISRSGVLRTLRALAQPLYYIHLTDIEVHKVSEEMTNAMASQMGVEFATKRKSATETVLPEDESSFKGTAISTADGAKILKIDSTIVNYI